MREIKFRIWDNLKKEWISNKRIWPMRTYNNGIGIPYNVHYWKQHPEGMTFQQYTGVDDKNGEEIYEGDIVKYKYGGSCVVKWVCEEDGWDYNGWMFTDTINQGGSIEVIGNIFESPELLENSPEPTK